MQSINEICDKILSFLIEASQQEFQTIDDCRSVFDVLTADVTELFNSVDNLSVSDKRSSPLHSSHENASSTSKTSPGKNESIATIVPSASGMVKLLVGGLNNRSLLILGRPQDSHNVYVIVDLSLFPEDKSVVYYGTTGDIGNRWCLHKQKNGFTDEEHAALPICEFTEDNLLPGSNSPQQSALITEIVIEQSRKRFSPISDFKAGQGSSTDPYVEKCSGRREVIEVVERAFKCAMAAADFFVLAVRIPCTFEGCDKTFAYTTGMLEHYSNKHETDPEKKKRYTCTKCPDFLTFSRAEYISHNAREHNQPPECPFIFKKGNRAGEKCGVQYVQKLGLFRHLKSYHGMKEEEARVLADYPSRKRKID